MGMFGHAWSFTAVTEIRKSRCSMKGRVAAPSELKKRKKKSKVVKQTLEIHVLFYTYKSQAG
jgi:hypothetical protein